MHHVLCDIKRTSTFNTSLSNFLQSPELFVVQPVGQTFTYPPLLPPSYGILPPNSYPTPFLPGQPYGTLSRVPYQPELSDGEDDDMIETQVMSPPFT
ncbi:hypothetical protein BDR04DRAFT_1102143 [Suillus decipiens]|nr:hypothetical protein BDR04DRAFT_1109991 [Suillus decipiens]KAG2069167.1 hypothetical protein BDR04DRAFT_1102143 [Suillus decipiens]